MALLGLQKRFNFGHNNFLFHDCNFIKSFQEIRNWFRVVDQSLTCHFRESSRRRSEHWVSCDDLLDFSGPPCRFWTFLERYRAGGCESLAVDTLRWSSRRRCSRSTWTSRSTLSTRRSNPRLAQRSVLFSPLPVFYRNPPNRFTFRCTGALVSTSSARRIACKRKNEAQLLRCSLARKHVRRYRRSEWNTFDGLEQARRRSRKASVGQIYV